MKLSERRAAVATVVAGALLTVSGGSALAASEAGAPLASASSTPDPSSTTTSETPTSTPSRSTTPSPTDTPTTPPPTTPPPTTPPPDPDPTTPAPTPTPTGPSSPEPTPEPTDPGEVERKNPDDAYSEALEGAQTLAVAEAQKLLQQVLADIDGATGTLTAAQTAADAARAADLEAQKQLLIAQESASRTQREIAQIVARAEAARNTVGAIALEAYQGNGLGTLGVVLDAETPDELTARYVGMRTLLRAGDSALGSLAADEADLRNAQARFEGQRAQRQALADEATATRQASETAELAATTAQAALANKSQQYQYALSLAQQARLEDYQRYMELINESTALANQLAGGNYGPGYGSGTFVRPGTGGTTSEYGPRLHPILGYVKIHTGLDFGRGDGTIYAADSGTVVEAKWNNAYGFMVVIDHGEFEGQRLTTMYAHQPGLSVTIGQRVEKGQVIGQIGSTGYSTGPHLHFEVRLDGQHVDPWPWVVDAPSPR